MASQRLSQGNTSVARIFDGANVPGISLQLQESNNITVAAFALPEGAAAYAIVGTQFGINATAPIGGLPNEDIHDYFEAAAGSITTALVAQSATPVVRLIVAPIAYAIAIAFIPEMYAETSFTATGGLGLLPDLQLQTVNVQFQAYGELSAPALPQLRTLGCGLYSVWLNLRGGTAVRELPNVSNIIYNRTLNGVSEAQITVGAGGGSVLDPECCSAITDINPWQHEIAIYRGSDGNTGIKDLVWVGPVRRIEIDADQGQVIISAKDLFSWFDRRFWHGVAPANSGVAAAGGDVNPDLDVDDTDLSYIWNQVVTDALYPDNPGIIVEAPNNTNIPAARFVSRSQYRYAGDILREIANQGIDYTFINRTLRAGASEIQTPSIGTLTDWHFAKPPRLIVDGDTMATRWVVGGGGTGQDGPDEAGDTSLTLYVSEDLQIAAVNPVDATYGLLEQYVFQPEIEDRPGANNVTTAAGSGRASYPYFSGAENTDASYSIYAAARTRYELNHLPYTTIEGGELDPSAPFDFNTLIPGSVMTVKLGNGCRDVAGYYRLREVSVTVDENRDVVDVRFENLGTSSTVVPTPNPSPSTLPLANPPIYVSTPPYGYFNASFANNYDAGPFSGLSGFRGPAPTWYMTFVLPNSSGTPTFWGIQTQHSSVNPPVADFFYKLSFEFNIPSTVGGTTTGSGVTITCTNITPVDIHTTAYTWSVSGYGSSISGMGGKPYLGFSTSSLPTGSSPYNSHFIRFNGTGTSYSINLVSYNDLNLSAPATPLQRFTS